MENRNHELGRFDCTVEGGPLIVGLPNTLRIKYYVGQYGIDDGGSIWIIRHGVTDWQNIQLDDAGALGYSSVSSNAEVKLVVETPEAMRPYETAIRIKVQDGYLREGDYVEFVMGDRSKGSAGILVQTVAEEEHLIFVAVDPVGSNRYEEIGQTAHLKIHSGGIADYHIVVPSSVVVDEPFVCHVRVIDDYGNRCEDFSGQICMEATDGLECPSTIRIEKGGRGTASFTAVIHKQGVYRLRSSMEQYRLHNISNPCATIEKGEKRVLWGDMHGQNKLASGIGTMDESLTYARDVGVLDFSGWQGNDFEVSDKDWKEVCAAVTRYHQDGKFVVFLGYEWSGITGNGGDHNIYFRGDTGELHRSGQWLWKEDGKLLASGRRNDGTDCPRISDLWRVFAGRSDVMAIPHVGGRYANFDFFNEDVTSVIEIYSHHGIFEWFLEDAMKRNMKVGFIAASDDHTSRMGLSYPMNATGNGIGASFDVKSGLTGVITDDFSRAGIWKALKERSCYAATSNRMLIDYRCCGHAMGEEFNLTGELPEFQAKIYGNAPIEKIELYRGLKLIYQVLPGEMVPASRGIKRIKIVWSGVRTRCRRKSVEWTGAIYVKNALITEGENYSMNSPFEGIQGMNRHVVSFQSKTSGDESGIILDLISEDFSKCEITFASRQGTVVCTGETLEKHGTISFPMGGLNCKVDVNLLNVVPSSCDGTLAFVDRDIQEGLNGYYIKAYQTDGNRLWSSPIFINYNKSL